jgi:16S rRNA (cytosine1402-N4)-methyltransferase
MLVERSRMSLESDNPTPFHHTPVMLGEVLDLLIAVPSGVVLDATLGGAGHARALLEAAPQVRLVGLDQDDDALASASDVLRPFGQRAVAVKARFDRLGQVLDDLGVSALSGVLFDLGVSSPQLDRPERGFSYRSDAPLDMRMDRTAALSADEVINTWSHGQLAALFAANGEERFAGRIAGAIVDARPIASTGDLTEIVRRAIPAATRRSGGHPAKRVFQAVRIAVNDELNVLGTALDAALARLAPGGRIVVLSYHSGEDRIVKGRLSRAATGGCVCPPGLPCVCGATPTLRLLNRGARKPSAAESAANPRAESARLRAGEALG